MKWITGRAFHGFRKGAAGEVHRLTNSERDAADWIGDADIRIVRRHYLKKRAEEQQGVANKINVDATKQLLERDRSAPSIGGRADKRKPITHGTRTGYNRGCRCDACTATQREHSKADRSKESKADRPKETV